MEDQEVVILLAGLTKILTHDNHGDRLTEAVLMVAHGQDNRSTRPPKHEGNELEKRGTLRKSLGERAQIGKFEDLPTT